MCDNQKDLLKAQEIIQFVFLIDALKRRVTIFWQTLQELDFFGGAYRN